MLILYLVEPLESKTLQQWEFEQETLVRIGRANDNNAVISSDLISRYHLEIHQIQPQQWQLISKGTNGTFCQGKLIDKLIISSGLEVQLSRGGPCLKFEILPASPSQPQQLNTQAATSTITTSSSSQTSQLENILSGLNTQFSKTFLTQRQEEINKRLGEIQELQIQLRDATILVQKMAQYPESLLKTLSANYRDLELQKQSLKEFQTRISQAEELLEEFQKHLESNAAVAKKLPREETRVDQIIETVRQQLEELDRELGRIHAQHLLNSAKRSFSL